MSVRAGPNQGYRALDALDLYTVPEQRDIYVPPQFAIGLNVFAGQLYFGSKREAIRVCHYLGINFLYRFILNLTKFL
ncbi:hypothetical protein LMH87_001732 [Akanthomyces muscarius]|uniref:Uncharacterized protein n=1 Tax=Akanthomyces muscarius TaxID=2231603 RepID=A0A9W8Q5R1_AKAMU|nr:hypothetical protein LMH87_001732 [Akanthomyces muscarius]KAJ4147192.1 hypothetical protein LMH87_001732 [Akanthomyces muscarius]